MPLSLAAVLLLAGFSPAFADEVPEEITKSWDEGRKNADKYWVEQPFKDEWGVKRSVWARRDDYSPMVPVGDPDKVYERKVPLFLLETVSAPKGAPEGVTYKKAVLSAYEITREKVGTGGSNYWLTSPGTPAKLRADSPYTYEGVSYPAKPVGEWVVLAPKTKEKLKSSPMSRVGTWPLCSLSPNSSYNGKKYAAVFEKLHPTEVELAYGHDSYGQNFTSSADFVKALDDAEAKKPETAYSFAAKLRKAVYPDAKAKGDATPPEDPKEQLTAYEAKLLACQVSGLANSSYEEKFLKGMRDAKDAKVWVKNWRGFLHAELKAYAAAVKDLPGAKATDTPWEGYGKHDYNALATDLKSRTQKAIDSAGAPPSSIASDKPKVTPSVKKKVDDAGGWAEDLVR